MNFRVLPLKKLRGAVLLPASKSYSIRAFFIAACGGRSRIIGASDCDDAMVARDVAKKLGEKSGVAKVNVRESGTSLRFVLPLLPFYCASAEVCGTGTLVGRPNHHLCAALRACGLKIRGSGSRESVPVRYSGGAFSGGVIRVDGSVSSQFISALMIALPLSRQGCRLVMTGRRIVSRDYVVMTRQILECAGIRVVARGPREFFIPGGQRYEGLKDFHVPSDWGLAAFWMSAAAISLSADIRLKGHFNDRLVQSDGAILRFLMDMGLEFTRTSGCLRVKGPCSLKGRVFSLRDCPDLVPIMAVTAMFAKGPTRLKDIGHARVKESDRISDLRKELLKVGADIQEKKDELIITPRPSYKSGVTLDPHHDHRLAMAFAVLGTRIGVTVKDIECTSKSYPGFVKAFKSLLV